MTRESGPKAAPETPEEEIHRDSIDQDEGRQRLRADLRELINTAPKSITAKFLLGRERVLGDLRGR
jgi:hypothetical protein